MEAARAAEHEFFANSPVYCDIADVSGTIYLSKKLNLLLLDHIKSVIPDLKQHVDKLMEGTKKQMDKLGMFDQENIDPSAQLLYFIKLFSDTVNHTIDGGFTDATKELMGGARLDYIFNECFAAYVRSLSAKKDLTDEYIRINSRNMSGMHSSLFPSDNVFVALSKQQIARLEEPSVKCVSFVYEELLKIIDICASKIERFPQLRQAVVSICQSMLLEFRAPTSAHVRTIISAERGFINTKHPEMEELAQRAFLNMYGSNAQGGAAGQQQPGQPGQPGQPAPPGQTGQPTPPPGPNDKNKDPKKGDKKFERDQGKGIIDSLVSGPSSQNMGDVPSRIMLGNQMSNHEQHMYTAIREMVEGYFAIVKGNISDQVPKAITLLMITRLREEVYARLVRELYSDKKAQNMLSEAPQVAAQRKAAKDMMNALTKAQSALNTVRDYSLAS
ncbi:dynamin GTPase [Strigomonas culicis]|uniref:Dynamin GTPase n=1 Tax=Strigomonas culicis TaxID=28005 RepID=S9UAL2_9TRYP|nr:dynamin GTPase [Strigomonas culicis]|eukprot:EPY27832.1 dynamin GTPase [Strigomonas culicis]